VSLVRSDHPCEDFRPHPDQPPPAPMSSCSAARHHCVSRARVVVEVSGPTDLEVLDAIARLALCARRLDVLLEVHGADRALVELVGLSEVLEVRGQPEPGEQRGVEEVVDVGDPPG
jgi:hypothetical protein